MKQLKIARVIDRLPHFIRLSAKKNTGPGIVFPDNLDDKHIQRLIIKGISAARRRTRMDGGIVFLDIQMTVVDTSENLAVAASELMALMLYDENYSEKNMSFRDGVWSVRPPVW